MGFGHRVYRAEDPRARVLRRTCRELNAPRYEAAAALEQAALAILRERRHDRAIETNVEFWAAVILDFAGVPAAMMPAMFTCARTAGWSAHILEQKKLGRTGPPVRRLRPATSRASRSWSTDSTTWSPLSESVVWAVAVWPRLAVAGAVVGAVACSGAPRPLPHPQGQTLPYDVVDPAPVAMHPPWSPLQQIRAPVRDQDHRSRRHREPAAGEAVAGAVARLARTGDRAARLFPVTAAAMACGDRPVEENAPSWPM